MSLTTISRSKELRPWRDINYCYWLGKDRLYSLSRVFRDLGLKPDFTDVDPAVIHRAACRGKLVEQYCYRLLQGQSVTIRRRHTGSLQETVIQRVNAFYRWMEQAKPVFVDQGRYAWSAEDRVCWQEDFKAFIKGRLYLIDIKCTSSPAKDWPLQIGCGLEYDKDAERGAVLHLNPGLNKSGFKFREYRPDEARTVYRRAVSHWKSGRDFQRLKAELGFDADAIGLEVE